MDINAHGLVNGHDLWREIPEKKTGRIVLDAILETRGGPAGVAVGAGAV